MVTLAFVSGVVGGVGLCVVVFMLGARFSHLQTLEEPERMDRVEKMASREIANRVIRAHPHLARLAQSARN